MFIHHDLVAVMARELRRDRIQAATTYRLARAVRDARRRADHAATATNARRTRDPVTTGSETTAGSGGGNAGTLAACELAAGRAR